nr:HNH endonuclease signature motif containing protein [Jiangella mangrovi]
MPAGGLVAVAQARQRQLAHDEAALLRVFAELAARPQYQACTAPGDLAPGHAHRPVQAAGDEVSLALRWTPGRATSRVALAVELLEDLPDTLTALDTGLIDADQARLIAERTRCLPSPALRRRVEQVVLPVAAARTRWVLDQTLRREVIAADPAGADTRRATAAQQRRVGRPEPANPGGDDAMATLTLHGPAEDLTALWVAADAAARHTRTTGDPRTLDQLRLDLLTGLAWTALDTGHLGCCNPTCTNPARATPADHPEPMTAGPPAAQRDHPRDTASPVTTTAATSTPGPVVLGQRRGRAATVHVTVPITALAGVDETPAELDGFGPIPAATARRIAADATLRRLLTDPADGRLLEYGRTTYAPPADLAAHVVARDRTCRFPTCHRPATEAEIDHRVPWAAGGTTDPANTWALHGGHHKAKTWHGYRIVTDTTCTTWWTTPAGHRYRVEPETIGTVLAAAPAPMPTAPAPQEAVPF